MTRAISIGDGLPHVEQDVDAPARSGESRPATLMYRFAQCRRITAYVVWRDEAIARKRRADLGVKSIE